MRKSQENTSDYQIQVEDLLMKGFVSFEHQMFTVSKGYEKSNGDTKSIRTELRDQLERYHWEVQEAKDSFGRRRITMTGKEQAIGRYFN